MIAVHHNSQRHRYEVYDNDECAGFATYELTNDHIAFTRTEVDRRFSGRGMARRLVTEALDGARQHGLAVLPLCPYVRRVIALLPEQYLDLVPMRDHQRFELPAGVAVQFRRRAGRHDVGPGR